MSSNGEAPVTGLYAKIAYAQETMPDMPRDKHVEVKNREGKVLYGYDYITEDALTKAMRSHLASLGVATFVSFPEVYDLGEAGGENVVRVRVAILLVDSSSGEREVVTGWGDGTDRGDKAIGKAQTSGERQLLGKLLLQAGGDDGEQANTTSSRSSASAPGGGDARPATDAQIKRIYGLARQSPFLMDGQRVSETRVHDLVGWVTRDDEDGPVVSLASLTRDQVQRVFTVIEKSNGDGELAGRVAASVDEWVASRAGVPVAANVGSDLPWSEDRAADDSIPFGSVREPDLTRDLSGGYE